MELPNGQKSRLDKLEQKLYSVDGISSKERPTLHQKNYMVENDWKGSENESESFLPKKRFGFFSFVLIIAGVFFLGSILYAGFIFLNGKQSVSTKDVDIKVVAPVSVGGGEKLSLDVIVSNNNDTEIELVDLFVEYPEGSKNPENISEDLNRDTVDLGTIPAGSVTRESLTVALFGEENSYKKIDFTIQYRIPGSNAIFEKKKEFEIALSNTPIRLSVSGLQEMSAGQPLELTLKFNSNSAQSLKNVMVVAEYPFGFKFEKASINPKYDNNVWVFDEIKPNQEIEIKISGGIEGQNQEDRIFRFNTGLVKENSPEEIGVLFATAMHEVKIAKAFIGLDLKINENTASVVAVKSGEFNDGQIYLTNNTNDAIKNVEIKLQFTGSVLDESSIKASGGFYRSIDNTIVWNKETDPLFANIAPRTSKQLNFGFKAFNLSDGKISIKNPQIDITAKISGIRISSSDKEESVTSDVFKNIKILSDTPVFAYTNYDNGPFVNKGPIPPKVDTPTTYTIELVASNNSNDLEGAQIVGYLPSFIAWKNVISPTSEKVSFDSESRKFVWDIGNIAAGTGYTKPQKQLYFQVEFLPSISQVGKKEVLLNDISFGAKDTFTRTNISKKITSPTTFIKGYPIAGGHDVVVE
jgi:hypothetical protein